MEATVILAEAAAIHPDGTFSLLKGGIHRLHSQKFPVPFAGTLLLRLACHPAESGQHRAFIRFMDEDGRDVAPKMETQFHVPEGGGYFNWVIKLMINIPSAGRYSFNLVIDDQLHKWWPFEAIKVEKTPPESGVI
jgi:hypothetical protein